MGPFGMPEIFLILVIALIVFGPKKLPELGRSLGKSLGEFKRASYELRSTLEEEVRIEEQKEQRAKTAAALAASPASPASQDDTFDPGAGEASDGTEASEYAPVSAAPIETPADLAAATQDSVARGTPVA